MCVCQVVEMAALNPSKVRRIGAGVSSVMIPECRTPSPSKSRPGIATVAISAFVGSLDTCRAFRRLALALDSRFQTLSSAIGGAVEVYSEDYSSHFGLRHNHYHA